MIKKAVQEAFNEQIKNEIYSAYLYLSMNAHFTSVNLNGFANWMRVQSGEEWLHAMKLYDFLQYFPLDVGQGLTSRK
jgi:ferritin